MGKVEQYRQTLRSLDEWDSYLLQESGLPGPRGNIELAQAVADEGDEALFRRYLTFEAAVAPTDSPYEFLAFCGVVGLGQLAAEGTVEVLPTLRLCASDPRWRIREAVCMALQRLGRVDMPTLMAEMKRWSQGTLLEKRAAAAALCEPNLLSDESSARFTLALLDAITASIESVAERRSEEFKVLRQGLGYCWSVAVVADSQNGKPMMEKWCGSRDHDIIWIMRQNLKKKRLERMDPAWVSYWQERLEQQP